MQEANGKSPKLDFVKIGDWICREGIVGIQWVRPQVCPSFVLLNRTYSMVVYRPFNTLLITLDSLTVDQYGGYNCVRSQTHV